MDLDSDSSSEADSVDEIIERHRHYRNLDDEDDAEGVYDLASGDDDDDDDEYEDALFDDKYRIQAQKEDMASDLEDEDGDDIEKHLPDAKSWGSKKADYYSTDYVDVGKRKYNKQDDEDADAEEAEALAIQRRLLKEMQGVDQMDSIYNEAMEEEDEEDSDQESEKEETQTEKVKMNISSLSDREKDQLLRRLHPELLPLLDDFKKYTEEAATILEPIVKFASSKDGNKLKLSTGYHIVNLKFRLVTRYIALLSEYFLLKAKGTDIKKHPLTPKLLNFKKLISEVDGIMKEKNLKKDIKVLAQKINLGETVIFDATEPSEKEMKLLDDISFESVYAKQREKSRREKPDEGTSGDDRRNITYDMAKNKGLTGQKGKKKEVNNPRVKHRRKFKKALVRRKGQVREPRKEVTKYAGELTGIKADLVKSIKFKK